jgi:hypothetical protein
MVPDFRRDDVWTPAFAGVTLQETFSEMIMIDGFVKSPSVLLGAGLRFNPALLDNNPALGIQG